jgi:hypothetical protein
MTVRDPRDVLLAPVISEKSYGLLDDNQYTFVVLPEANKTQIKIAVEQVFNVKVLSQVTDPGKALVVVNRADELTWLSLRNVQHVHLIAADQLNAYDVLCSDAVVFTKSALDSFVAGAPKGKSVKAVATSTEAEEVEA